MDNPKQLNEQDWRRLLQTLQRGQCVLLLGPRVAVDPAAPGNGPLTARLAQLLTAQLPPGEAPAQPDYLAHVAQLYYQNRRDRMDLEFAVEDFFAPYADQTTPLHKALAGLPFTLCIHTGFDRFFGNALRAAGKTPVCEYYHFRKVRPVELADPDPAHPLVYSLYGDCREGDSLVLTENDLLEFLVNVIRGAPKLPAYITARFSDPKTSFLFLGFGFRQWYIRILLHVLQAHGHSSHSLAVEDADFFTHPDQLQTTVFYERSHYIQFRHLSWQAFAAELGERYARLAGGAARETPLPPDAPVVFLSYSHQDQDDAEAVTRQLQARGIQIWLDRQALRGGDNWEQLIPHVIKKQVDYLVVLQSPELLARVESYCYREIDAALERQRGFAPGIRFLIPALLAPGAGPGIPTLATLHSVDLTTPQGIQELAGAILEDWNRRGRRRVA